MRAHIHGRRGRRSGDIPWLLVATIIGIAVVVIVALVFFAGLGGSSSATHTTTGTTSTSSGSSSASSSASSSSTTTVVAATTTPVTISNTGVTIKVDYLGGFSGTYTANGNTTKIKDSGTKVYTIDNASGTVTATLQKTDNTATHALTVTIYKNGSSVATNSTSAAHGAVTVQTTV